MEVYVVTRETAEFDFDLQFELYKTYDSALEDLKAYLTSEIILVELNLNKPRAGKKASECLRGS